MNNSYPIYFLNTHGIFLFFLIVAIYLWFFKKSKEEVRHIVIACLLAGIVTLFIKELSNVPRPYLLYGMKPLAGYSVRTTSFPSLHTSLAFALATTVTLHQRKFGIVLLLIAALIGLGRVEAHVHYPIDVAVGAVVGTVVALLVDHKHS